MPMPVCLFFLTTFHADIVFGLACLCGIVLDAGLLLLAALLAAVRWLSLHRSCAQETEHHDKRSDGSHDDLLSVQPTNTGVRPGRQMCGVAEIAGRAAAGPAPGAGRPDFFVDWILYQSTTGEATCVSTLRPQAECWRLIGSGCPARRRRLTCGIARNQRHVGEETGLRTGGSP